MPMGEFEDVVEFLGLILAFFVGFLIGLFWCPRWAIFRNTKLESFDSKSLPPKSHPFDLPQQYELCRDTSMAINEDNLNIVTSEDLENLCQLVEAKDCGPTWRHMMDRSTPTMTYKAWQRDQKNGPPQYRSSTIFENATPELVRDFFWDDEFRLNWDNMLVSSETIHECPITGTMIVHMIRKFPLFCKDREYIVGRRIWESARTYYCVTKGVTCPSIPRKEKPRRVDLYYSSWCIRAVECKNGQQTACEVLLFHHEDMGIPWEITKFGVSKGMWGVVKKMEPGFRTYQRDRFSGVPISRMAFMANINTKIKPKVLRDTTTEDNDCSPKSDVAIEDEKPRGMDLPKKLAIGGVILFACTFNQGLLTKSLIFGRARRFANDGNRL